MCSGPAHPHHTTPHRPHHAKDTLIAKSAQVHTAATRTLAAHAASSVASRRQAIRTGRSHGCRLRRKFSPSVKADGHTLISTWRLTHRRRPSLVCTITISFLRSSVMAAEQGAESNKGDGKRRNGSWEVASHSHAHSRPHGNAKRASPPPAQISLSIWVHSLL
jgi:hypothetical protein